MEFAEYVLGLQPNSAAPNSIFVIQPTERFFDFFVDYRPSTRKLAVS
jgi:hypothetical protein